MWEAASRRSVQIFYSHKVAAILLPRCRIFSQSNASLASFFQVEKTADGKEIKKAYRKLAIQHHPDKGGDEHTFKEVRGKETSRTNRNFLTAFKIGN